MTTVSPDAVAIIFELKKFLIMPEKFLPQRGYAMESRRPQQFSPRRFLIPSG